MFKEKIKIKGQLSLKIYQNGVLIEHFNEKNLIMNLAYSQLAQLVAGNFAGRNITQVGFGTNGAGLDPSNTSLTGAFIKNVNGFSFPNGFSTTVDFSLANNEANGLAIMEFGLFTADGTLFARRVRTEPLNKTLDIKILGQWTLIFAEGGIA